MHETREEDRRESNVVFTQNFGQNSNGFASPQIGCSKSMLAETNVTERIVAERGEHGPAAVRLFAGFANNLPQKLWVAVLCGVRRRQSIGDSPGNEGTIRFDANMTAHENRVMAEAGRTKTSQRIRRQCGRACRRGSNGRLLRREVSVPQQDMAKRACHR